VEPSSGFSFLRLVVVRGVCGCHVNKSKYRHRLRHAMLPFIDRHSESRFRFEPPHTLHALMNAALIN
jgi:hypothetical protein